LIHATRHRPPAPASLSLLLLASLALGGPGCQRKGAKAFNQGQAHLAKKRYAAAIESFEKAVRENPDFGEAFYNLGAARFQLAADQLDGLVQRHGSPALKATLKATAGPPQAAGTLAPDGATVLGALTRELRLLPVAEAELVVTLLRQALAAKLKARALFRKGRFVVIRKASLRRAMIAKLDHVERLQALLLQRGAGDRGLWLVAVARPALLPAPAPPRPRPHPKGATRP
jgi:tetratricopeptide (TPR) repeat protein